MEKIPFILQTFVEDILRNYFKIIFRQLSSLTRRNVHTITNVYGRFPYIVKFNHILH